MKLNPIYKKLLLLTIVFGPIFWLVFTEDGQRRADLVLISLLKDTEEMNIAFSKLRSTASESDIRSNFPDVPLHCENRKSRFGDRMCVSEIAAFNGAPASYAAVFFDQGRLSAIKMTYQPHYHDYVQQIVGYELGNPVKDDDGRVWRWNTEFGAVLMSVDHPGKQDESTVIWFSGDQIARSGASG